MVPTRILPVMGLWKYTVHVAAGLLVAATMTAMSAAPSQAGAPPMAPFWNEFTNGGGDAGDFSNPQLVGGPVGMEYSGITGTLGAAEVSTLALLPDDLIDVYGFWFDGDGMGGTGNLSITMSFPDVFDIDLYDMGGNFITGSIASISTTISAMVGPGNYFVEITTGAFDPPFTINAQIQAFRPVSEPAGLAVLSIGLVGLALARRRRRQHSS